MTKLDDAMVELAAWKAARKTLVERAMEQLEKLKRLTGALRESIEDAESIQGSAMAELLHFVQPYLPADEWPTLQQKFGLVVRASNASLRWRRLGDARLRLLHEAEVTDARLMKIEQAIPALERLVQLEQRPKAQPVAMANPAALAKAIVGEMRFPDIVTDPARFAKAIVGELGMPDIKVDIPPPPPITINLADELKGLRAGPDDVFSQLEDGARYKYDASQHALVEVDE